MRSLRAAACAGVLITATLSACSATHSAEPTATQTVTVTAPAPTPSVTYPAPAPSASQTAADTAADPNAILSYNETEPSNPLIPGDTIEVGGIGILGSLFTGLVDYDPATGAPSLGNALSIKSSDSSRVYTITLKPGWTFQNGEPVTAQSYVDAWNYTAYSPNLMAGSSYLSHIQGFSQVNNLTAAGTQPHARPAKKELSGLKVVNSSTFVVTLAASFPDFEDSLGYSAFFPLPASFFSNVKGYIAHPIGDGPFQFVSYTKGKDILVKRYNDYAGPQKAKIGGIDFEFYTNLDQAYAAVKAGKLDYLSFAPWNSTPSTGFPASQRDSYHEAGYQAIGFPLFDKKYDNVKFRQAVSMAINRPALIKKIFGGVPQPADGLVPPDVQGYTADECGSLCTYQPALAKKLFQESGFTGTITLTSNIDSGNEAWVETVCAQLQQTLGTKCTFDPSPTLGAYFDGLYGRTESQIFRTAWVADYPAVDDFLDTVFETGGSNNVEDYSNPTVNSLLTQADSAPSTQKGFQLYQQAEKLILRDMPIVPVFYLADTAVWVPQVHNVIPTIFRELDFTNVTMSQ